MSDRINIYNNAESLKTSPEFPSITKVVLNVNDTLWYVAGTDSTENNEHTLEYDCPWATQQMANNVLAGIKGFTYKPYEAQNALLDPAAELGDEVRFNGFRSTIYKNDFTFGALPLANISAEGAEEIDHEFPYESKSGGKELKKKLNSTGGDSTTFGWNLGTNGFTLSSDGEAVFTCDATGIKISGNAIIDGIVYAKNIMVGDDAGHITSEQLASGAIEGVSISDGSINGSSKLGSYSVSNGCMGSGSISLGNQDMTLTAAYNQTNTNKQDITQLKSGNAAFNNVAVTNSIIFGTNRFRPVVKSRVPDSALILAIY